MNKRRPLSSAARPPRGFSLQFVAPAAVLSVALVAACCGKQRTPSASTAVAKTSSSSAKGFLSRPHVTVVAFSDWQSVLKPCGCTAELQRGGIERNARYLATLRRDDDSVVAVHAGSLLAEDEAPRKQQVAQRRERMTTFAKILEKLDFAGVSLSSEDLERGGSHARELYENSTWPVLTSAASPAVSRATQGRAFTTPSGLRVGLIGVDPKDHPNVSARNAAVKSQVSALRKHGAKVVIALSNLGMRHSRRLGRAIEGLDVVVVGAVPERSEPVEELDPDDTTLVLRAPRHGAYMAVLTLVPAATENRLSPQSSWTDVSAHLPGAATRIAAQLASVEEDIARFTRGASTTVAMQRAIPYFEKQRAELKTRLAAANKASETTVPSGSLRGYAAVGLPWSAPVEESVAVTVKEYDARVAVLNAEAAKDPLPLPKGQAGYVGAEVCMACHVNTRAFVQADLHSHAWLTLEKKGKTRDLDCVLCHSTGFGRPGGSGFGNIETFKNVQCEACHGPGSLHVGAPAAGAKSQLNARPGEEVCLGCHTPEHAPRFDFGMYRKRLVVPGHGLPVAQK